MANSARLSSVSQTLHAQSLLQGNTSAIFETGIANSQVWSDFAQSWNELRQDEYMGDGGKYRYRRYSEFLLEQRGRTLIALPHMPYRQSKEDNYLNGDIDRMYSPMLEGTQENSEFKRTLFNFADLLSPMHPSAAWLVQVFQNRILANDGQPGKPTPEGVHRDGVDYVLTLMINRHNVSGGESSTYEQDGLTLRASVTLQAPGDFIFLNDKLMKHSVQPISRVYPTKEGYRDVLIAMFSQRTSAQS